MHPQQIVKEKNILRKKMLRQRNSISDLERNRRERLLAPRIGNLDIYKNSKIIIGYVPMKKELSPMCFFAQALQDGKQVYVPLPDKYPLHIRPLYDIHDVHYYVSASGNTTRIPVPRHVGEDIPIKKILYHHRSIMIVPGLGFSQEGRRIGRGGGFYDRLLAMQGRAISVGVCFHEQLCTHDEIPLQATDIDMRYVVAV